MSTKTQRVVGLRQAVATVGLVLLGSGCAFIPGRATITYTPQGNVARIHNAESVKVNVAIQDLRPEPKNTVSYKGIAQKVGPIRATSDVGQTVRQAIETELTQRGFVLGTGGVAVSADLAKFYNDWQVGMWSTRARSELIMNVKVNKVGGDGFNYVRIIQANGIQTGCGPRPVANASAALNKALSNGMASLFADAEFLDALLKAGGATPPPVSTQNSPPDPADNALAVQSNDATERPTKIEQMKNDGAITEDEYQRKRQAQSSTSTAPPGQTDSIPDRLTRLKNLRDSGTITEEEYQVQRKVLVEKL